MRGQPGDLGILDRTARRELRGKPALMQKSIAAWTLYARSMMGDYGILAQEWAVKAVNPADQEAMPSAIPEIMSGSSLASTQ